MNSFISICPKCGRGYIRDMDHRCDPLDTDFDWFQRVSSIWFVLFVAAAVVLILWILL